MIAIASDRKNLADATSGLPHPTPMEIRSAILSALNEESNRRHEAGLGALPWNMMKVIDGAIRSACDAHYAKQDETR